MYLLIVLDALGSFSINVKQHEINWTNFRQQLIFLSFTVLYIMPINKRNACHKYRVFAKHTSYLYNIYQTWK